MLELFGATITAFFINSIASLSNGLGYITPSWLSQGISDILGGANILNALLPMYAHPGMLGIAGETGLMPMFAWLAVALFVLVGIKVFELGGRLILRILPWSTNFTDHDAIAPGGH